MTFDLLKTIAIVKWDNEQLLEFFKINETVHLDKIDISVIKELDITGSSFLNCTKKDLFKTKLRWGRVIEIVH